jgi:hypothetical protein
MHTTTIMKRFFWISYAVFLSSSIPHIAYFFRAHEPMTANVVQDAFYWTDAYLIAIVIDVMSFLLSMTVTNMIKANRRIGAIASVWVMILFLAAFSWRLNYEYARQFASSMLSQVDGESVSLVVPVLNWNLFTMKTADLNPLLASMFQVFILFYTWISDKIFNEEKPVTAAELKQKLDEEEALNAQLARARAMNKNKFLRFIDDGVDVGKHAFKKIKGDEDENVPSAQITDEEPTSTGPQTDGLEALHTNSIRTGEDIQSDQPEAFNPHAEEKSTELWKGFTSRQMVTVEVASTLLNVTPETVSKLRSRGVLKTSGKNKNLITIASIKAYDEKRSPRNPSAQIEGSKPALKIVANGQQEDASEAFNEDEEGTDDLFQAAFDYLKEHPSCTDEELAQHLQLKRPASARFWRLKVQEVVAKNAV